MIPCIISAVSRQRICIIILLFTGVGLVFADDSWQPIDSAANAAIEIPQGWSLIDAGTPDADGAGYDGITAMSPDRSSRLIYTLEKEPGDMDSDAIKSYQVSAMAKRGYRICMTKDPIITSTDDSFSYQQTYVRGSSDAAVIATRVWPAWGRAHVTLLMEGPEAVSAYYDTIPPGLLDHITPLPEGDERGEGEEENMTTETPDPLN